LADDGVTSEPCDLSAAVGSSPVIPWSGRTWRFHSRRYEAISAAGSLKVTGRFHRGLDQFDERDCWPALYLALKPHIALGERLRHTSAQTLAQIKTQRLTELNITLEAVLDCCAGCGCTESAVSGIAIGELCTADYVVTHALAAAARMRGVEAIMVPSCTGFRGGNLVLFPDPLRPQSTIDVVGLEQPILTRER
jgi:RES domain-containing protein